MLNEFTLIIILMILGCCVVLNILYINLSKNTVYATFSLILVFLCSAFILLFLGVEFLGLVYITVYVGAISVFFIFILMIFDLRIVTNSENTKPTSYYTFLLPSVIVFGLFLLMDSIIFYSFFFYKKYPDAVFLKYIFDSSTHEEFANLSSVDLRVLIQFYQKNFNFLPEKEQLKINEIFIELERLKFSGSSRDENVLSAIESFKYNALENIGFSLYNDHFISFIVVTVVLLVALVGAMALAMNSKKEGRF